MIELNGRVAKVDGERCLITIPNDTSISDVIQVYTDKLAPGQPVRITIEPIKVKAAGVGRLIAAVVG